MSDLFEQGRQKGLEEAIEICKRIAEEFLDHGEQDAWAGIEFAARSIETVGIEGLSIEKVLEQEF